MQLNDDPQLAELTRKSRQISDRLEAIAARRRELQEALEADDPDARLEAALAGVRTEAPSAELAALAADEQVLRRRRAELKEELAVARRRASRTIARELVPEHRAAVAAIAAAIVQLRAAIEGEVAVRRKLAATGADPDALPGSWRTDALFQGVLARLEAAAREYCREPTDVAA